MTDSWVVHYPVDLTLRTIIQPGMKLKIGFAQAGQAIMMVVCQPTKLTVPRRYSHETESVMLQHIVAGNCTGIRMPNGQGD